MFERKDADVILVTAVALGLLLFIGFLEVFLHFYLLHLRKVEDRPPSTEISVLAQRQPPPEPRIQVDPKQDLEAYLEHEKQLLSTYGWVDREKGIARIPIERAMELTAHEAR